MTLRTNNDEPGTAARQNAHYDPAHHSDDPATPQGGALPANYTTTTYRDILDIQFVTHATHPHLATQSTLVLAFQYLRRGDPTCRFLSADRSVEWERPNDLPTNASELREKTQFKEYPISAQKKCANFTIYFESSKQIQEHRAKTTGFKGFLEQEIYI